SHELVLLLLLVLVTGGVLAWMYNDFVFSSFNPSLALSRQVRVRLCSFAFIVLLALIVNLSLQTVGALLITAMLVVPAAAAANVCRNMRQLFWTTVGLCLGVGVAGEWICWNLEVASGQPGQQPLSFDPGGV